MKNIKMIIIFIEEFIQFCGLEVMIMVGILDMDDMKELI
jgi:hypothetical protein